MKRLIYLLTLTLMASCNQKLNYPTTKKQDITDDYFGTVVEDPYRWLENDTAPETEEWVKEQNEVTFGYLSKLPNRDKISQQLTDFLNYERIGTPSKKGNKYFFFKNDGLQNQSVLYMTDSLNGEASVLLDPNQLSEDGTIALSTMKISDDAKYLVYSIARSGSDWNEVFVKDIETGRSLDDHLMWVKFSGLAWYDGGIFYSRYDEPEAGSELSKLNEFQKVYYHKIGTPQSEDVLVKEDLEHSKRMWGAGITEDKRFLILSSSEGTSGNALMVKDLSNPKNEFVSLMESYEYDFDLVDNIGDQLYIKTNYKAPRYRLVKIDFAHPAEENWTEILPEQENVLESASFHAGQIVAQYMKDAHNVVEVYHADGKLDYELQLPGIGTVGEFTGEKDETESFFSYTSFNTPGEIYQYNYETKEMKLYFRPKVGFNPDDFVVKQAFYTSKDSTKVPMFIVHKKGIELDGNNPTLLYGYGGFNISLTPSYSSTRMVLLENGGVLAIANLRGGGEYGEEWHKAGTKLQKQNVFDDCIAAAEYLVTTKYTNPDKLALMGGSNGGLLVGAVINQRPDLFKVALPAVGVLDMLRYQNFTIGWAWAGDYGRSDDSEEMFKYLYNYSPYHNIKANTNYPAILVTTADHDDRVVPAHSFKYAARMQELANSELPALIRIDTKAGHGAGKPTTKIIEEYTDVWSFTFYHLGMKI
ncbi:prolyl oligopeptidase family serine peptidase [Mangrovibacterium diazotrophicum]|uniref:prolyl oligopeptidase n=1 Tax=Mangrovibacterium diazotrophicum TaxID=1261403 RepID=A0A419WBA0_9BACT|nr:prolyl oligopeptidase family serine peptidase [Mangrovibacterium diazotrophicum]RKD92738.1 prolyl oligopeptidase [Mangrovibacterium diazotrophicum]